MRTLQSGRLFGVCLCLLGIAIPARANLVICAYLQNQLFVAADSCVVTNAAGGTTHAPRVFRLGDSACASLTGFGGPSFKNKKNGQIKHVLFTTDLEQVCQSADEGNAPLPKKIQKVVTHFGERYRDCLITLMKPDEVMLQETRGIGTRIAVAGFDPANNRFFGNSYRFSLTNRTAVEPLFEKDATNKLGGLSFQGDTKFLGALLSGEPRLTRLPSDDFRKTLADLYSGAPVSEERVIGCVLEMFRLNNQYAAAMGYETEPCNEPYSVFRITRDQFVQVR
jgi:hypothetical protein